MRKRIVLVVLSVLVAGLSGCGGNFGNFGGLFAGLRPEARSNALTPDADTPRPVPRSGGAGAGRPPPEGAVTVEDFDTTSTAERAAALEGAAQGGTALGRTIASLGSPARPGFWLETPLVTAPARGRVVAGNGMSVLVDLLPLDAPAGAGSRISLAALRLLGVSLGGLHELEVFRL